MQFYVILCSMNTWSKILAAAAVAAATGTLVILKKCSSTTSKALPEQSGWSRPLGDAHETFLYRAGKSSLWNIATVQTFLSKYPVTHEMVHNILLLLARSHPILRVGVQEISGIPVYKEVAVFQVPLVESDDSDWMPLFEQFLKETYNDVGPLWRVAVVRNNISGSREHEEFPHDCTLVFGAHHSIMDGASFMSLYQEFLTYLEQILTGEQTAISILDIPVLKQSDDLPLEEIIPEYKKTLWQTIKVWALYSFLRVPLGVWLYKKSLPIYPENEWVHKFGTEIQKNGSVKPKTSILPNQLTSEETKNLLTACTKHKVTVQSAMAMVACIASAKILQEGNVIAPQKIGFSVPFSMRRHFPKHFSQKMMGSYYDTFTHSLTIKPTWEHTFWEDVQEYHNVIQKYVQEKYSSGSSTVLMDRAACAFQGTELTFFKEFSPGSRFGNIFSLSNLGNCAFIDAGLKTVKLKAGFSAAAEHVIGSAFSNTLCTIDGKLCWGLVYYPNIMTKQAAENIWQNILDVLHQQNIIG